MFQRFEAIWKPDPDFDMCLGGYMFPGGRVYNYVPPIALSLTHERDKAQIVPIAEALRRAQEEPNKDLYIGHSLDKRILNSVIVTKWFCGNFYHKAFLGEIMKYATSIPTLAAFWCDGDGCFFCFNVERHARQMCIETKAISWFLIKVWGKVMIPMFGPVFEPDVMGAKNINFLLKLRFDPSMPHFISDKESLHSFF